MGRTPVSRVRLRKKAAERTDRTGLKDKGKPPPDPPRNKPFTVDRTALAAKGGKAWETLVKAVDKHLELSERQLASALEETDRRLAGTRPTEDQIVGTFFEVVASVAPLTVNMREGMVAASLDINIRQMMDGKAVFFSTKRSGGLDLVAEADGFSLTLDALPIPAAERAQLQKKLPPASASPKARAAAVDALVGEIVSKVTPKLIQARDLTIGGREFVDRAVFLPLADGRMILLISEEYKAPKSGGGGVQSALRINRLFNSEVGPETILTYIPTADDPLRARRGRAPDDAVPLLAGGVILSSATRGVDQILVKASAKGRGDAEIFSQKRTGKLAAAKRAKGEWVRKGKTLDLTIFKQFIGLPGRQLRAVVRRLR